MRLKSLKSVIAIGATFASLASYAATPSVNVTINNNLGFTLTPQKAPEKSCTTSSDTQRYYQSFYGCGGFHNYFRDDAPPTGDGFKLFHKLEDGQNDLTATTGSISYNIHNKEGDLVGVCMLTVSGKTLWDINSDKRIPSKGAGATRFCSSTGFPKNNTEYVELTFPVQDVLPENIVIHTAEALGAVTAMGLGAYELATKSITQNTAAFVSKQMMKYRYNKFIESLDDYMLLKSSYNQMLNDFASNNPDSKIKQSDLTVVKKQLDESGYTLERNRSNLIGNLAGNSKYLLDFFGNNKMFWEGLYGMDPKKISEFTTENSKIESLLDSKQGLSLEQKEFYKKWVATQLGVELSDDHFNDHNNVQALQTELEKKLIADPEMAKKVVGNETFEEYEIKSLKENIQRLEGAVERHNNQFVKQFTAKLSPDVGAEIKAGKAAIEAYEKLPAGGQLSDDHTNTISRMTATLESSSPFAINATKAFFNPEIINSGTSLVPTPADLVHSIKFKTDIASKTKATYNELRKKRNSFTGEHSAATGILGLVFIGGGSLALAIIGDLENINPTFVVNLKPVSESKLQNKLLCDIQGNKCIEHTIQKHVSDTGSNKFIATAEDGLHYWNGLKEWQHLVSTSYDLTGLSDDDKLRTSRVLRSNNVKDFAACYDEVAEKSYLAVVTAPVPGSKVDVGGLTVVEVNKNGQVGAGTPEIVGHALFKKHEIVALSMYSYRVNPTDKAVCAAVVTVVDEKDNMSTLYARTMTIGTKESDFVIAGGNLPGIKGGTTAFDSFGHTYSLKARGGGGYILEGYSPSKTEAGKYVKLADQFEQTIKGEDGATKYSGTAIETLEPLPNGSTVVMAASGLYFSNDRGIFSLTQDTNLQSSFIFLSGTQKSSIPLILQNKLAEERSHLDSFVGLFIPGAGNQTEKGLVVAKIGYDQANSTSKIEKSEKIFPEEEVVGISKIYDASDTVYEVKTSFLIPDEEGGIPTRGDKTYHVSYDFSKDVLKVEGVLYSASLSSGTDPIRKYYGLLAGGVRFYTTAKGFEGPRLINIPDTVLKIVEIPTAERIVYSSASKVYVTDFMGQNIETLPGLEAIQGKISNLTKVGEKLTVNVRLNDGLTDTYLFQWNKESKKFEPILEGLALSEGFESVVLEGSDLTFVSNDFVMKLNLDNVNEKTTYNDAIFMLEQVMPSENPLLEVTPNQP